MADSKPPPFSSPWGFRPRSGVFVLLVFLSALSLALCGQVDSGTESRPAIGFHLGQSYGASVAHFPNGTIVNLAKVPASAEYTALLQRVVRQPATPHRRSSRYVSDSGPTHWRVLRRLLGLHPTPKAAILADLVAALKVESEAALGSPITTVSVTAPWVGDWQDELPTDSVVNDALASAGLKPWTMEARWPVYLGEAGAVHAANGKWHCQHQSCGISNLSFGWPDSTFFISFTNESVYTVIHAAQCFFQTHEVNPYPSSISTQYGLSHLASAPTPVEFWDKLRLHLLDQVALFSKRKIFIYPTFEVVTAGEAADHPDFLEVVQEVHREIPRVREEHGILGFTPKPLVVSEDPGWAAARGAAFWLGTRMDPHYCDEVKKIAEEAEQLCRRWKLEGCRDEL